MFDTGSLRAVPTAGALQSAGVVLCTTVRSLDSGRRARHVAGHLAAATVEARRRSSRRGCHAGARATAAYAQPYIANAQVIGVRDQGEVANFSAQLASYVTAPQENWLWGWTAFRFQGDELRLFPGLVPIALAVLALARRRLQPLTWIYVVLVAIAVSCRSASTATVYPWLHAHVWAMKGFRAPVDRDLACCALAVLAGFGFAYLTARFSASQIVDGCSREW